MGSFPDTYNDHTDLLSLNKTESYTLDIISNGDKKKIWNWYVYASIFLSKNASHCLSSDAQNLFAIKEIMALSEVVSKKFDLLRVVNSSANVNA